MAKAAKTVDPEITEKVATKFVGNIFERLDVVDEARNKLRVVVHRERDAMNALYEGLAALGVPQKSSRMHIKIALLLRKAEGLIADLETHERKMAEKLARAAGDKRQLSLMLVVPKPEKTKAEPKAKRAKRAEPVQTEMETVTEASPALN